MKKWYKRIIIYEVICAFLVLYFQHDTFADYITKDGLFNTVVLYIETVIMTSIVFALVVIGIITYISGGAGLNIETRQAEHNFRKYWANKR